MASESFDWESLSLQEIWKEPLVSNYWKSFFVPLHNSEVVLMTSFFLLKESTLEEDLLAEEFFNLISAEVDEVLSSWVSLNYFPVDIMVDCISE